MNRFSLLVLILFFIIQYVAAQHLPVSTPYNLGFEPQSLEQVDVIIQQAVDRQEIPGAVLMITRHHKIAYHKAYGFKQLLPEKVKMDLNTIFDLASVSKPVATATAAMILIDKGQIRLLDPVSDYVPDFQSWIEESTGSKTKIRIKHLMTHTSGLPDYVRAAVVKEKYGASQPDSLIGHIAKMPRHHAPGTYFKYSCLNFITLQRIIEKVSGQSLKDFTTVNVFSPLKMKNTMIKPPKEWAAQCAPTEILEEEGMLQGVVHDPLARVMMDCVSGNAGLFSNTHDLAIFSSMMLNQGTWNNVHILSPAAVRACTNLVQGYEEFGRGLGWDLNSDYSSNQGDLFSEQTYGHTGFTGTSLIIDPVTETAVILLTNRIHPYVKGSVVRLRSLVANVVAGAMVK